MSSVLLTLLDHVRVEASHFGRIELGAPWGSRIGERRNVSIHHVLEGEMWIDIEGSTHRVVAGDLVVLPRGVPHVLRHSAEATAVSSNSWSEPPETDSPVHRVLGGDGARTVVLCASLELSGPARSVLIRSLPALLHLKGDQREAVPGLGRLLDGIRDELRERRAGSSRFATRFAEMLLFQAVRGAMERAPAAGFERSSPSDPRLSRALDALYRFPERDWTVVTLARVAGQSRSGFARHFQQLVGEAPLRHLTRYRVELAQERLLREPRLGLAELARAVGYASEAAFSTAFRREVGVAPGAFRSTAREADAQPRGAIGARELRPQNTKSASPTSTKLNGVLTASPREK